MTFSDFLGPSSLLEAFNTLILPIKLIVPQPVIRKVPGLTSNEELRFKAVSRHISGHLLDMGCGYNKLLKQYKEFGGTGVGVDIFDWGGVDVLIKRAEALPFEDNTFDTVTMIGVINHMIHREEALRELNRVMKPGGKIIITIPTPIVSLLWHKYAWWDEDQTVRGMEEGEIYGFTLPEMKELFSNSGFEFVKLVKFMCQMNRLYIGTPNNK